MKLLKPTYEYSEQIMEYRQAFLHSGEEPHGSCSLQNFDSIGEWFEKVSTQEEEKIYHLIEYHLVSLLVLRMEK